MFIRFYCDSSRLFMDTTIKKRNGHLGRHYIFKFNDITNMSIEEIGSLSGHDYDSK